MTRNIPNVFGLPAEMIEKQGDKALRISTDLAFREFVCAEEIPSIVGSVFRISLAFHSTNLSILKWI